MPRGAVRGEAEGAPLGGQSSSSLLRGPSSGRRTGVGGGALDKRESRPRAPRPARPQALQTPGRQHRLQLRLRSSGGPRGPAGKGHRGAAPSQLLAAQGQSSGDVRAVTAPQRAGRGRWHRGHREEALSAARWRGSGGGQSSDRPVQHFSEPAPRPHRCRGTRSFSCRIPNAPLESACPLGPKVRPGLPWRCSRLDLL